MTRVYIETLGCKLNQAESETMRRNLAAAGFLVTESAADADVFILNSCTVTHVADRKARQAIRSAVKAAPGVAAVVTGCYAERDRISLARLPGVVAVLGNAAKENIASELVALGFKPEGSPALQISCRTRSMIKIQDGCDHRCAYCIVPAVRPEKSCVPPDAVVAQILERQAEGFKEIVITGTEIGEYRWRDTDLAGLLRMVLSETLIERIRISSLQPQEVTPELIGLWSDRRLCRHFHLSLQSGSDSVLKRMRRRYTTDDYRRAVELIRLVVPGAAITTDIIAGFPGETAAEFEESCDFIESMDFARLHVFTYSTRPGTAAAGMPEQVPITTARERATRLLKLGRRCEAGFRQRFEGQTLEVLFEGKQGDEWVGYTDNYIRVTAPDDDYLTNRILKITI